MIHALPTARSDDRDWRDPATEPHLDEILSDPVIRLVMRRDRLDPADVRRMLVAQAALLRASARAGL